MGCNLVVHWSSRRR